MTKTISKTKRTLALVAIFFSTLAVMADLAITPVIGMIYGYYPDHTSAVNYIVSGPMLVLVAASLITPLLTRRFNKKTIFIAAAVIFSIGAIFGAAADDPLYICFTRTLVGIGEGVINAVGIAYIADLYENPQDRNKITGFYNAAQSLMGMILSYAIAGITLLLLIWFPGQATALVIGTICGLTYKVLMSYNYGHGFSIVPASRADDVSSITTAVYGLGSFLCTYFATWLMQLMHTDLVTPTWYVGAIGFILITVLDIFVALRERKRFGA